MAHVPDKDFAEDIARLGKGMVNFEEDTVKLEEDIAKIEQDTEKFARDRVKMYFHQQDLDTAQVDMVNIQVDAVHGMQAEEDKLVIHKVYMVAACQKKMVDG